ncbi:MAG: exonuclease SbcCD subunit D [Spirochaetes bacterium]|nr:MAG: exonuclease SbcCD subunit D [Spirochaetota bacterium]
MTVTLLHLSDTHLGYSELDRVNAAGVNCREADFYDAFNRVIDAALDLRPDAVIHTGDFFHRPSPANRPMIEGLAGLRRLSDAGIPAVIIAGNHSTPRTVYTSPILKAFQAIPGVHPIFEQRYERVELDCGVFHGVPHVNDELAYREELEKIEPDPGKTNVLMLHTSVGKGYLMEEYGERVLDGDQMVRLDAFDYTALGHWHGFQRVKGLKRAYYCGSTERLSDREAGSEKGFALVKTGSALSVEFRPLPVRPWIRYDIAGCGEKSVDRIRKEISECAGGAHEGAVVSLYLLDLKPEQGAGIPNAWIAGRFPGALAVQVRRAYRGPDARQGGGDAAVESLEDMFADYLARTMKDEAERARFARLAAKYFSMDERGG